MNAPDTANSRFERRAVQVSEAQHRIETYIEILETEEAALDESFGRRLAEDVTAGHPLPHFRRAGMDGFALRAADIESASPAAPAKLEVIESIPCGDVPEKTVTAGTAARIMTGAMLPEGADTVIMLEMSQESVDDGKPFIAVCKPLPLSANVSQIGSELSAGTLLLEKGTRIFAGETALLASFGYAKVPVYRQPKVAVIATGSELIDVHEPLQPGKIRNSNMSMLAALVKQAGGKPILIGKVSDHKEQALQTIENAFRQADLVVTSGGVSVGDFDILTHIFESWDGRMLFNKVAMRPGSPTTVGVRDGKFLFALSGNPSACFVGFELFVRSVIYGMQGEKQKYLTEGTAYLAEAYPKVNAFTRYVRGKWHTEDGRIVARQVGKDQSGVLSNLKDADCLMLIPPGGHGMEAGDLIQVLFL